MGLWELLSDLGVFSLWVPERWQAYVTGGALVALLAAAQWIWGYTPSRCTCINIFVIGFLFVAFFLVWREEYVKNKPTLVGMVKRIEFFSDDKGDFIGIPLLQVRNNGSVPMGIENFKVIYTSAAGDVVLKLNPFTPTGPQELEYDTGRKMTLKPEDTLFTKMGKPIGAGGDFIIGLVPFHLPGVKENQLKDAIITFCFDDMATVGHRYCTAQVLDHLEQSINGDIKRFPGERVE